MKQEMEFKFENIEYSKKLSECKSGSIVAQKEQRMLIVGAPELSEKEEKLFLKIMVLWVTESSLVYSFQYLFWCACQGLGRRWRELHASGAADGAPRELRRLGLRRALFTRRGQLLAALLQGHTTLQRVGARVCYRRSQQRQWKVQITASLLFCVCR